MGKIYVQQLSYCNACSLFALDKYVFSDTQCRLLKNNLLVLYTKIFGIFRKSQIVVGRGTWSPVLGIVLSSFPSIRKRDSEHSGFNKRSLNVRLKLIIVLVIARK